MEGQKTAPVALKTTAVFSCPREVWGGATPARMLGAAFPARGITSSGCRLSLTQPSLFAPPGLSPHIWKPCPQRRRGPPSFAPPIWRAPCSRSHGARRTVKAAQPRGKRFPATHGNPAHGAASVRPAGTPCLTHKKAPQAPAPFAHEGDFPASGPELPARRRGAGIRRSIRPQAAFQLSSPLGASARQAQHVRGA